MRVESYGLRVPSPVVVSSVILSTATPLLGAEIQRGQNLQEPVILSTATPLRGAYIQKHKISKTLSF